jgi:glucose/arabinose dehydrogenase/cytochrome c2
MKVQIIFIGVALTLCCISASAADSSAGRKVFQEQCTLCHSAESGDNGGAQGPGLNGVFGKRAASQPAFTYTQALSQSGLVWDAATLERFLASPSAIVPGTSMVMAVPDKTARDNIVAYLSILKQSEIKQRPAASLKTAREDWRNDAPGRLHRIDPAHLPAPFATDSARNSPQVVAKPDNAKLSVPTGFRVEVFASELQGPRTLRVAPNGDILVAETPAGQVKVIRPSADGAKADKVAVFARGLAGPFGIELYPRGAQPQWVYIAENNRVVRYAYKTGDLQASGVPQVVVPELMPASHGGHTTRDLAFSADGKRMFISVGSESNVAESMPKKTSAEIKAWEARQGLGAAWGNETNRADVLVFEVGSDQPGKTFATGIRNCVGLTVQPQTGDLWCTTNERDLLGDDLVPDYSTRVKQGGFYGWPWYYIGNREDPRLKGDRPDLAGKALVPDVLYQAHSAALSLVFYSPTSGNSVFPKPYWGDGFAVLHGSWNHNTRTGHKVVRVRMKDSVPTGEYEDFLTGFIIDDSRVWGRPAAAEVAQDGSLLVSDDAANLIYRISMAK